MIKTADWFVLNRSAVWLLLNCTQNLQNKYLWLGFKLIRIIKKCCI